jgi:hypothetical protein
VVEHPLGPMRNAAKSATSSGWMNRPNCLPLKGSGTKMARLASGVQGLAAPLTTTSLLRRLTRGNISLNSSKLS